MRGGGGVAALAASLLAVGAAAVPASAALLRRIAFDSRHGVGVTGIRSTVPATPNVRELGS